MTKRSGTCKDRSRQRERWLETISRKEQNAIASTRRPILLVPPLAVHRIKQQRLIGEKEQIPVIVLVPNQVQRRSELQQRLGEAHVNRTSLPPTLSGPVAQGGLGRSLTGFLVPLRKVPDRSTVVDIARIGQTGFRARASAAQSFYTHA